MMCRIDGKFATVGPTGEAIRWLIRSRHAEEELLTEDRSPVRIDADLLPAPGRAARCDRTAEGQPGLGRERSAPIGVLGTREGAGARHVVRSGGRHADGTIPGRAIRPA